MRYAIALVALFAFCCVAPGVVVTSDSTVMDQYVIDQRAQRNVLIKSKCESDPRWGGGSGVILDNYRVLTAAHVVNSENCEESVIKLFIKPGSLREINPVRITQNKELDIALIEVARGSFPGMEMVSLAIGPSTGADIFTIGYPMDFILKTYKYTVTKGNIATEYPGWRYRFTAPIQPGNSGGGIYLRNGDLVGVVTSYWNAAFGIPYDGNYFGTGWPALDPMLE